MPEIMTKQTKAGKTQFTWTIQEYDQHDRINGWYWFMGILGLALVGYGMFTGNFLFAVIILLYAIILFLQSHQAPQQLPFKITDLGIIIGTKFYSYNELESFYIVYDPPSVKMLYFETESAFKPLLRVPLLDENPLEIRMTLLNFLDEDVEKEEEPLSDHVARKWQMH